MDTETKTVTPHAGFTWTDPSGLPRATNGAWTQEQTVDPTAPVVATPPTTLSATEQAAADWRSHRLDGKDLVSLRSNFSARADFLQLRMYDNAIADLRRPAPTRRETAANWNRATRRTMQRKAA